MKSKKYPNTKYILSSLRQLYMMTAVERLIKASDYEVQQFQRCILWPQRHNTLCHSYQFPFLLFSCFPRSEIALDTSTSETDLNVVFMTALESNEL